MGSIRLFFAAIAVAYITAILASPAPVTSKSTVSDFFLQYLPDSNYTSVGFASMLPDEGHINGQVTNRCSFPIYVRQAVAETSGVTGEKCQGFGETSDMLVNPGETYISERPTYWDGCGSSLKVSRHVGDARVYQVEYSVDRRNGKVWYNLSAENGAPFQDVDRKLYVFSEGCMAVHCAPGQYGKDEVHGCDWPIQPVCAQIGRVMATLC